MAGGGAEQRMKRAPVILLLLLALALTLSSLAAQQYRSFLRAPLQIDDSGMYFLVERGATVRSVISDLDQSGLTRSDWRWWLLTRLQPQTIQAGEYTLEAGLRPQGLLVLLASGAVIQYRFTIVEGWTFRQLVDALSADPVLIHEVAGLAGQNLVPESIGAAIDHPEGWFLPETYQFIRGDSDLDILRRAHQAMLKVLHAAWAMRDEELPLRSAYELLTLASIVEKESSLESERADIAGVFVRRLEKGWRLETDPSVIYGLGPAFDGDIRRRDLDTDSPYNTYTRYGLPPTPIAMPGKLALQAAATPAAGSAMFFVASGTGGHVFSDTLDDHNAAVRKMLTRKP